MNKKAWIVIAIVGALIVVYELMNGFGTGDTETDGSDGGGSSPGTSLVSSIVSALSGFENVAARHNNPAGMSTAGVPNTYGTVEQGIAAAEDLASTVLIKFPEATVQQFVNYWQSGKLNPTDPQYAQTLKNYAQHVADFLGIGVNDAIASAGGDGGGGDDDSTDDEDDE